MNLRTGIILCLLFLAAVLIWVALPRPVQATPDERAVLAVTTAGFSSIGRSPCVLPLTRSEPADDGYEFGDNGNDNVNARLNSARAGARARKVRLVVSSTGQTQSWFNYPAFSYRPTCIRPLELTTPAFEGEFAFVAFDTPKSEGPFRTFGAFALKRDANSAWQIVDIAILSRGPVF